MKVLYLYMFPLWGNGSGNWLRRLTANLKAKYIDDYQAAIVAPDSRFLKHKQARLFRLHPPIKGVFVGNPELPEAKKYSKFSPEEMILTYNYYLLRSAKAIEKFRPNVIHCFHTAFLPPIARQLANLYRIPYLITTHGSDLTILRRIIVGKLRFEMHLRSKFITANSNFTVMVLRYVRS